jgi:hypothetical protein
MGERTVSARRKGRGVGVGSLPLQLRTGSLVDGSDVVDARVEPVSKEKTTVRPRISRVVIDNE